jgi:hypothetical protein
MELAVDEIIGGRNTVQALHFRGPRKSGDAGLTHQNGHESLADSDPHPEGELSVHPPGTIGLPRSRMNLSDQPSEPLPAHLRSRERPALVSVIAGTADPEEPTAHFDPIARLNEDIDYRVNPFGPGRTSPNSFAATFRISTSVSSCRIRFFAFANSILSGVVIPGLSPRSI